MAKKSILNEFVKNDFKKMAFNNHIENIHYTKIKRPEKNRELRRIEELAEDIREDGLENNLLVRKIDDPQYEVERVGGERRFTAIMLNIEQGDMTYEYIPCKVVTLSDLDARKRLILNNHLNDPLTNAEKIEAVEELREIYRAKKAAGEDVPGRIQQLIAKELGVGKSTVANYEKILNNATQEVRDLIKNEDITIEAAVSLVDLDEDEQIKYVKEHDTYNKKDIEKFKAEKEIEESEVNLVNHQLQFNEQDEIVETVFDEEDELEQLEYEEEIQQDVEVEYVGADHTIEESMTVIMSELDVLKEKVCGVEFKAEVEQLHRIEEDLNKLLDMFGLECQDDNYC